MKGYLEEKPDNIILWRTKSIQEYFEYGKQKIGVQDGLTEKTTRVCCGKTVSPASLRIRAAASVKQSLKTNEIAAPYERSRLP